MRHAISSSCVAERPARAMQVGVYLLSAWVWVVGWITAAPALLEGISNAVMFYTNAAAAPVALGAAWAAYKGYGRAASVALIAFVFVATASIHWDSRDYNVASLLNLAVLTFFAGWALNVRGLVVVVLLCQALLISLVLQDAITWQLVLPLMCSSLLFGGVMVLARKTYDLYVRQLADATGQIAEHEQYLRMLSSVVEQSPYSLAIVDQQGRIVYVNATFLARSGYTKTEAMGRRSREISLASMDGETYAAMHQIIHSGNAWHGVLRSLNKAGESMTEQVMVTPIHDEARQLSYFVEAKLDISERIYAQERIHQLVNYDKLTQLPNRFALQRKLDDLLLQEQVCWRADVTGQAPRTWHSLLLLDVDRFNQFNMAHGSQWGDSVLIAVGLRLQELQDLYAGMWVARYNADQFAVVLERIGTTQLQAQSQALSIAEQLQNAITRITLLNHTAETVELSIGVGLAVFPLAEMGKQADNNDRIVRRAALALMRAKQSGLKQICAYAEHMAEQAESTLKIERGLRVALTQGQLRMYVQPQYDKDGQVVSMEALVRWQHPENGLISPGEFIPVAEQSGLIVPLGEWMLEQACMLLQQPLMQQRGYSVAVNISAQQFVRHDFVDVIEALLQRHQVPARRLVLEVTESMLLADLPEAVRTMQHLKALGVQFALDDFGTGYSSLAYLQQLPIDELKIDQSFIRGLDPEGVSGALVQAVLMVAQKLNLRVVAEGIEHVAEAQLLQAWAPAILCQGYLYSRPMPVAAWLEQLAQPAASEDTAG